MLETRKTAGPRASSDREFGLVMAIAFSVFSLISAWKYRGWPAFYLPALAFLFLFFALAAPRALRPLNRAWSLLGRSLHLVVNPLILAALYFLVLTPFALMFRALKRDPLRLKWSPGTYWIKRKEQPGMSMANQF